jgi:hypothetical protein
MNQSTIAFAARKTTSPPSSPAEIALARKLVKAKSWEDRFEILLADDRAAKSVFHRLLGGDIRRHQVIMLLQPVSDPNTGKRLQQLLPVKEDGQNLARKLRKTAEAIRSFWKPSTIFALLPYRMKALTAADNLEEQANALEQIRWDSIARMIGYKTFWSQLPLAVLCWKLRVPKQVTYVELSHMLAVAVRVQHSFGEAIDVRGFSPRALGQTNTRFCRRKSNQRFMSAGGLDLWTATLMALLPD